MDDYSALAQRVAVTVGDVRGCLVLSRDGLVLGAYPEDESAIKPAWLKFATIGEPQKSFVEFGDQIWAYVHRGPYATFVVAGTSIRPGVLIDQMEQALLTAEEARTRREPLKLPDAAVAPSGKPRTSLHPPAERAQPAEVAAEVTAGPAEEVAAETRRRWSRGSRSETEPDDASSDAGVSPDGAETGDAPPDDGPIDLDPAPEARPAPAERQVGGGEDEGEIDRVLLAKEFSGLLQLDPTGDEDSP